MQSKQSNPHAIWLKPPDNHLRNFKDLNSCHIKQWFIAPSFENKTETLSNFFKLTSIIVIESSNSGFNVTE